MCTLLGVLAVGPAEAVGLAAGAQEAAVKEQDLQHSRKQNSTLEREVQRFKERDVLTRQVQRPPPPHLGTSTSSLCDGDTESITLACLERPQSQRGTACIVSDVS